MKTKLISIVLWGKHEEVFLQTDTYKAGKHKNTAVLVKDKHGRQYATLSVNLPPDSDALPSEAFYVKDWTENEELVKRLRLLQVIIPYDAPPGGMVMAQAYTINPKLIDNSDVSVEPKKRTITGLR